MQPRPFSVVKAMIRYLFFRSLQSILLIFGVLLLVFLMVRLTGDPAALMVSREARPEQIEAVRQKYGFDRPVMEQFAVYMGGVLQGDLGNSLNYNLPTTQLIGGRLPATFELAISALVLEILVAIPLGIVGGLYPRSIAGNVTRVIALLGQSVPSFVWALLFILIFALNIPGLPASGRSGFNSLILPAVALSLSGIGALTRLTRAIVLEIQGENYIRSAHAKGLSRRYVAFRHILPNAAIPLISVIGIHFTYMLGGSVYIETIFAWPGIGGLLQEAIFNSDFPLVQAITVFIAVVAIVISLFADVLYGTLDPRIRQEA